MLSWAALDPASCQRVIGVREQVGARLQPAPLTREAPGVGACARAGDQGHRSCATAARHAPRRTRDAVRLMAAPLGRAAQVLALPWYARRPRSAATGTRSVGQRRRLGRGADATSALADTEFDERHPSRRDRRGQQRGDCPRPGAARLPRRWSPTAIARRPLRCDSVRAKAATCF